MTGSDERQFPVLEGSQWREYRALGAPKTVPWSLLAPHEDWALANHDQSLEKLASRGGLGMQEMVAIIDHKRLRDVVIKGMTAEASLARLKELLADHEHRASGSASGPGGPG